MTELSAAAQAIQQGYTFKTPSVQLGVLIENGQPVPSVPINLALSMFNRHGLVAGATGTGKTRTLQLMAEQLSRAGVAVFAADIKGDLSGIALPGTPSDKLNARVQAMGQNWQPAGCPTEFYSLGGQGNGVPIRATVTSFGPILLSKVLGLNDVQESSLGLVFHYADTKQLDLIDLADLKAVMMYLTSDDGKADLQGIGGLSSATVGVILRQLVTLESQGADAFFGEPEFQTSDLLRTIGNGQGVISLLELPNLQDRPQIFSTFLMWLLADLFHDLPEVGDVDKPKLVFFFDEAHLLFDGASKAFLDSIAQTVRLIRSKGIGVFFVTQVPSDVPDDVLAQLGSRVQHQLRAHTPNDAKALKQAVNTYPTSQYDLVQVLQNLGIGEAIVTVLNPDGAPTPVAWTRMLAPQAVMGPMDPQMMQGGIAQSSMLAKYGQAVNSDSAAEQLQRIEAENAQVAAEKAREEEAQKQASGRGTQRGGGAVGGVEGVIAGALGNSIVRSMLRTAGNQIVRSIFGTARRR